MTVQINPTRSVDAISHQVISVEQSRETDLLVHLLASEPMTSTLVFARTKHKAKGLAQKLVQAGFQATSLQGNLSQNRRQQAWTASRTVPSRCSWPRTSPPAASMWPASRM